MKSDKAERQFSAAARRLLFRPVEGPSEPETGAVGAVGRHVRVKVTMNLDGDLVEHFKRRAKEEGRPYQILINDALREGVFGSRPDRLAAEVSRSLLLDEHFLAELTARLQSNPED